MLTGIIHEYNYVTGAFGTFSGNYFNKQAAI
jgi:hypothetical protein